MDRFARVVLGYHGCDADFAESVLLGKTEVHDWRRSENDYDWLGHGIYFWEHAPERALSWASSRKKKGVIGAVIQLGNCLDFTDVKYTELLSLRYQSMVEMYRLTGASLPENKGKNRKLDCLMVNELIRQKRALLDPFQTVRCPFLEGEPAFPGSGILKESHIQIAVIDPACILGVFRPNFGA